jgi:glyoxylase-like metal-dependent hydrolase (beta-lactamase superfamily II)/rhodanese-related sulfurtransferase
LPVAHNTAGMHDQFPDVDEQVRTITAAELQGRMERGDPVTILDTRRPEDFETWHIDGEGVTAVNVPFTEFIDGDDPAEGVPEGIPDEPMVTCCAKGISSMYVAKFLAREGYDIEALDTGMQGWAGLYEATELDAGGDATVCQFHRPSSGCLGYMVVDGDEALVVDPLRAFANEYVAAADDRDATLTYAVDTHVHADHVSGVHALADATDATPVVPAGALERGYEGDADTVAGGDTLTVGDATVEAVAAPGHTTEHLVFRVDDVLLAGDTTFTDSVARPDLEDEDAARDAARTLHDTLQDLAELPADTLVAPGHTASNRPPEDRDAHVARLGDLTDRLDAFATDRDEFAERVTSDLGARPANFEDIIAINCRQRTADDEEAFELELGPNNCAA